MNTFGKAPVKGEGMEVDYGDGIKPSKPKVETTYVERRVPIDLADIAHMMIDDLLSNHGYDPEEI